MNDMSGASGMDMNIGGVALDQAVNDGTVTQEEFGIMDANADGQVSTEEFEQFESLVDSNGDGEISSQEYEDFQNFLDTIRAEADTNGDGVISWAELDAILKSMGLEGIPAGGAAPSGGAAGGGTGGGESGGVAPAGGAEGGGAGGGGGCAGGGAGSEMSESAGGESLTSGADVEQALEDGSITQEQFDIIDANGDGEISDQEFADFQTLTDTDQNGEISADELSYFQDFLDNIRSDADVNNDGILSNEEFTDEVIRMIDEILKHMGAGNGNGQAEMTDFVMNADGELEAVKAMATSGAGEG